MIVANDATVKAGAFFPMTARRSSARSTSPWRTACRSSTSSTPPASSCRCRTRSSPTRTTSAASSATTRASPRRASRRSPPSWATASPAAPTCPVLCDNLLMTEGSGLYLAGPALVEAAIGQKDSAEELGGATMHAAISGTVDFQSPTTISASSGCARSSASSAIPHARPSTAPTTTPQGRAEILRRRSLRAHRS